MRATLPDYLQNCNPSFLKPLQWIFSEAFLSYVKLISTWGWVFVLYRFSIIYDSSIYIARECMCFSNCFSKLTCHLLASPIIESCTKLSNLICSVLPYSSHQKWITSCFPAQNFIRICLIYPDTNLKMLDWGPVISCVQFVAPSILCLFRFLSFFWVIMHCRSEIRAMLGLMLSKTAGNVTFTIARVWLLYEGLLINRVFPPLLGRMQATWKICE